MWHWKSSQMSLDYYSNYMLEYPPPLLSLQLPPNACCATLCKYSIHGNWGTASCAVKCWKESLTCILSSHTKEIFGTGWVEDIVFNCWLVYSAVMNVWFWFYIISPYMISWLLDLYKIHASFLLSFCVNFVHVVIWNDCSYLFITW